MLKMLPAMLLVCSSCEIQKEKYQNPRTRANREIKATQSPEPAQAADLVGALEAVRLQLPLLVSSPGKVLGLHEGAHHSVDACNLSNRLIPVGELASSLSRYLCVLSKLDLKIEDQEFSTKGLDIALAYQIRVDEDGQLDISVCENGKRKALFSKLVSDGPDASVRFATNEVTMTDGRVGAMDGRSVVVEGDRRFLARYVAVKEGVRVASLRFASFFDGKSFQFISFAGKDSSLLSAQVVGAGKFDTNLKKGVLFLHNPELQIGGHNYLDSDGLSIEDGPAMHPDLAKGGRLDIKWAEISKQLPEDFEPNSTGDWNCETKQVLEVDAKAVKSCEVQPHESIDCAQELYQGSIQTRDTDYPSLTDRFDSLKFDIF